MLKKVIFKSEEISSITPKEVDIRFNLIIAKKTRSQFLLRLHSAPVSGSSSDCMWLAANDSWGYGFGFDIIHSNTEEAIKFAHDKDYDIFVFDSLEEYACWLLKEVF